METVPEKILQTARRQSVFRAKDVLGASDPRSTLRRMVMRGELIQVDRGRYALSDAETSASHSLVEATRRYPGGVICLVSALVFHGIGTQMPHETWLMRHDRKVPPPHGSPVRFVYCTNAAFDHGMEGHVIEGTMTRIYTPAKTVADCFKYRNKIGLDIALEALREGWRGRRFTMDELWAAAKVCRVQGVMQPYLEMLLQ